LGTVFAGVSKSETTPKAISAAQAALKLAPDIAEAHVLLADAYQEEWLWSQAEAEFRRAIDLSPNDAGAHEGFAIWLLCQGRRDEALTWMLRARELDPIAISGNGVSWILFQSHRYDEAIREARSQFAVNPDDTQALLYLGFALAADGHAAEAIPPLEKAVAESKGSPAAIGVLIRAYAHAGRREDALRLLSELKMRRNSGFVPAGAFVNAYLGLGDNEQAFVWLEKAYAEHSNILQFLKTHPYFDPIRNDPRFKDLMHRVGLG
jgi:pentatricopeptide repeat protein